MIFLKNKTEWKRVMIERHELGSHAPPEKFPCFLYWTVHSFAYEEENAMYLYQENIEEMGKQFNARSKS
jgi:hypothetical protein